ncbi:hypothetical protein [Pararhodobacter sp.]|uniref:hypothetical protein n=1 Tax=Pararhodobacter sp. TaxID=2127056 RepID=UPI002AFEB489|nr:hypothetical protein [Pararhodobacter sp.]
MTTSDRATQAPMKKVTYTVTLKRPDGSIVPDFTIRVPPWKKGGDPVLKETPLQAGPDGQPLEFDCPHRSYGGDSPRLVLCGPADPARPDIKNYQHEIYLFRRTGGAIDFILPPCPTADLYDELSLCNKPVAAGPVQGGGEVDEIEPDPHPEGEHVDPLMQTAGTQGQPDFTNNLVLDCRLIHILVRDYGGKIVPGFSAQLQIHDRPWLTKCAQIDPGDSQGKSFFVRMTSTTTWANLYESATGKQVSKTPVHFSSDGNAMVTFVLTPKAAGEGSGTAGGGVGTGNDHDLPRRPSYYTETIKAPDQIRHDFVDGTFVEVRDTVFFAHEPNNKRLSSLAASILTECTEYAKAWVRLNHPGAQAIRLLAFENSSVYTFQIGPWGGDYQWLAYRWTKKDALGALITLPQVRVENLVVEWWA